MVYMNFKGIIKCYNVIATAVQAHLCGFKVTCHQRLGNFLSICILHLLRHCCTMTTIQCEFVMLTPLPTLSQYLLHGYTGCQEYVG